MGHNVVYIAPLSDHLGKKYVLIKVGVIACVVLAKN